MPKNTLNAAQLVASSAAWVQHPTDQRPGMITEGEQRASKEHRRGSLVQAWPLER